MKPRSDCVRGRMAGARLGDAVAGSRAEEMVVCANTTGSWTLPYCVCDLYDCIVACIVARTLSMKYTKSRQTPRGAQVREV